MATCPICNSKKGKRSCLIVDSQICSLCCGTTRKAELCLGCQFYQKPKRKYSEVPAYSTADMDGNRDLEIIGNAIEGAICAYDVICGNTLKDNEAIGIMEALIDVHHFGDKEVAAESPVVKSGAQYVSELIKSDLNELQTSELVKVLGVIRFVAKRRTNIGREYMSVIHQYVGQRVAPGVRVLRR